MLGIFGDRIVHSEIPELSEGNVSPDSIEDVHLKDVVENPVTTANRHLHPRDVVVEPEPRGIVVVVILNR